MKKILSIDYLMWLFAGEIFAQFENIKIVPFFGNFIIV